jgi:hypothetical protein
MKIKCNFYDGKYCKSGTNEWDGLCSVEACVLSRDKIIEKFGLKMVKSFELHGYLLPNIVPPLKEVKT